VKILFSPVGIIAIAILAFIIFFPRHPAEKLRKFGKPMRAFPDDEEPTSEGKPPAADTGTKGSDDDAQGSNRSA
jgi:hypothetical protein